MAVGQPVTGNIRHEMLRDITLGGLEGVSHDRRCLATYYGCVGTTDSCTSSQRGIRVALLTVCVRACGERRAQGSRQASLLRGSKGSTALTPSGKLSMQPSG